METLLQPNPTLSPLAGVDSLLQEQHKNPALLEMIQFLRSGVLPTDEGQPHKTALQSYGVLPTDEGQPHKTALQSYGVLPTDEGQPHKTALQSYGVLFVSKMHFYGRFINHTTTL